MVLSFVPWQDESEYGSQIIRRSFEALTDDLLFLFERLNVRVSLAAVFMEDQNSVFSLNLLRKTCESLPLLYFEYVLPKNANEEQVKALIESLNHTREINGVIVDLPIVAPDAFDFIDPLKNVRLNTEDYLKLSELALSPHEEDVLAILMMLEKTFDAAVIQASRQRGNPL